MSPLAEDITVEADSGGHTDNRPAHGAPARHLRASAPSCRARIGYVARDADRRRGRDRHSGRGRGRVRPGCGVRDDRLDQPGERRGRDLGPRQGDARRGRVDGRRDGTRRPTCSRWASRSRCSSAGRCSRRGPRCYASSIARTPGSTTSRRHRRSHRARDLPAPAGRGLGRDARVLRSARSARGRARRARPEAQDGARLPLVHRPREPLGHPGRRRPRKMDYQIWCGPAMGAFNRWVRGSFLADRSNRARRPDRAEPARRGGGLHARAAASQHRACPFPTPRSPTTRGPSLVSAARSPIPSTSTRHPTRSTNAKADHERPNAGRWDRDRRDRRALPGRARPRRLLAEHPRRARADPGRPGGLLARRGLLRPEPPRSRQGVLQARRVPRPGRLRSDEVRRAAEAPAEHRHVPAPRADGRRSGPSRQLRRSLRRREPRPRRVRPRRRARASSSSERWPAACSAPRSSRRSASTGCPKTRSRRSATRSSNLRARVEREHVPGPPQQRRHRAHRQPLRSSAARTSRPTRRARARSRPWRWRRTCCARATRISSITGGADTTNDPFTFMCFSKTPALSMSSTCRPFSESSDGTMLGEGIGMLALKRLADAERDGDRIYAVIRGLRQLVGRARQEHLRAALGGPGQVAAPLLRRSRLRAGDRGARRGARHRNEGGRPGRVQRAARGLQRDSGREDRQWCALGSIKSQLGHTKAAAGAAGLLKAVLALHDKVLPPTFGDRPTRRRSSRSRRPRSISTRRRARGSATATIRAARP